jgi:hypothetical protein
MSGRQTGSFYRGSLSSVVNVVGHLQWVSLGPGEGSTRAVSLRFALGAKGLFIVVSGKKLEDNEICVQQGMLAQTHLVENL